MLFDTESSSKAGAIPIATEIMLIEPMTAQIRSTLFMTE